MADSIAGNRITSSSVGLNKLTASLQNTINNLAAGGATDVHFISQVRDGIIPTRIGNTLVGIIDDFTGESTVLIKTTTNYYGGSITDANVDGYLFFKVGTEYFKRVYTGAIKFAWFGLVGDNATDNKPAWDSLMKAIPEIDVNTDISTPTQIDCPSGRFQWTNSWKPGRRVLSFICNSGMMSNVFNANSVQHGLFITYGGAGLGEFKNLEFESNYGQPVFVSSGIESDSFNDYNKYSGIRCSAVYKFTNVRSRQWRGHGWWFAGNVSIRNTDFPRGCDASRCRLDNCSGASNRGAGFMIGGDDLDINNGNGTFAGMGFDANQILFIQPDYRDNRWGMLDASFLGVQGIGNHGNNNRLGHLKITNINNITEIIGNYDEDGDNQAISTITGKARISGRFTGGRPIVELNSNAQFTTGVETNKTITNELYIQPGGDGIAFQSQGEEATKMLIKDITTKANITHYGMLSNRTGLPELELFVGGAELKANGNDPSRVAESTGVAFRNGFYIGRRAHKSIDNIANIQNTGLYTTLFKAGDVLYNLYPTAAFPINWLCVQSGSNSPNLDLNATANYIINPAGPGGTKLSISKNTLPVYVGYPIRLVNGSEIYYGDIAQIDVDPANSTKQIWTMKSPVPTGSNMAIFTSPVIFITQGLGRGTTAERPSTSILNVPFINAIGFQYFNTTTNTLQTFNGSTFI